SVEGCAGNVKVDGPERPRQFDPGITAKVVEERFACGDIAAIRGNAAFRNEVPLDLQKLYRQEHRVFIREGSAPAMEVIAALELRDSDRSAAEDRGLDKRRVANKNV